uniref:(northern house mosquito) hypothetical protein n=1 Tax=Culex pipiens TaxID=7175 RepID=A0A8D8C849_CULPI
MAIEEENHRPRNVFFDQPWLENSRTPLVQDVSRGQFGVLMSNGVFQLGLLFLRWQFECMWVQNKRRKQIPVCVGPEEARDNVHRSFKFDFVHREHLPAVLNNSLQAHLRQISGNASKPNGYTFRRNRSRSVKGPVLRHAFRQIGVSFQKI